MNGLVNIMLIKMASGMPPDNNTMYLLPLAIAASAEEILRDYHKYRRKNSGEKNEKKSGCMEYIVFDAL